jgi:hypothetical protein
MKVNKMAALILAAALLMPLVDQPEANAAPGETGDHNQGSAFAIDTDSKDQDKSRVAYSTKHGQFLVVYELDYDSDVGETDFDILGRFVDAQSGDTVGSVFGIATSLTDEYNPDVAYDPEKDRFVVVWEEDTADPDIRAKVVYGNYQSGSGASQFPDNNVLDITSGETAFTPAIANNNDDSQFAIVFRTASGGVRGRMAEIKDTGVGDGDLEVKGSSSFAIETDTGINPSNPDVAWSSGYGNFFVVYDKSTTGGYREVVGRFLYETFKEFGPQYFGGVNPVGTDSTDNYDCFQPSVAYDPHSHKYLTVFIHMLGTTIFDPAEIRGGFNNASTGTTSGIFLPIETTINSLNSWHYDPQVAYSGIGGVMHVVYQTLDSNLSTPSYYYIKHRNVHMGYYGPVVGEWSTVEVGEGDQDLAKPAIAGSHNGRSLVTWKQEESAYNFDIYGRRVAPYWVNLPIVKK